MFTLFESYLDTADWKRAESVFPDAARQLGPKEAPEWYSRIAVLAAKAGERAEAMRIWSRIANLDLSATGALPQLVKAGLRDELIDFYRQMQKTIPFSDIPTRVLRTLENQREGVTESSKLQGLNGFRPEWFSMHQST